MAAGLNRTRKSPDCEASPLRHCRIANCRPAENNDLANFGRSIRSTPIEAILDRSDFESDGVDMNLSNFRIFALAFAGIVFASANSASAQIVALGHSAVRGNVSKSEMWPAVLEGLLHARGSQVHVANAGVWGETTDATLARVSSAVPQGTRIVILVDNQANDVRRNMSPIKAAENIAAIKKSVEGTGHTGRRRHGNLYVGVKAAGRRQSRWASLERRGQQEDGGGSGRHGQVATL